MLNKIRNRKPVFSVLFCFRKLVELNFTFEREFFSFIKNFRYALKIPLGDKFFS